MGYPTARELITRDPAMAAIMGESRGADFGIESNLDSAWWSRADASRLDTQGNYAPASRLDFDAALLTRDNAQLIAEHKLAMHLLAQRQKTEERLALLDPNAGSTEKIERYTFSMNQEVVLGASEAIFMTSSPLTDIKPERLIFNAPCYGFAFITQAQIGNTSVIIGSGEDAANYSQVAVDVRLSMPLLRTQNRALIGGTYTGISPAPYTPGNEFNFTSTFHGPARMTT
jgi:hypothetical protein